MRNCLLTALPGVCTNTALAKIGALRITVTYRSGESVAPCPVSLYASEALTVSADGVGYFTDSSGTENYGASVGVPAYGESYTTIYPGNANFSITFSNPYALTGLLIGGVYDYSDALSLDLSKLRFMTQMQTFDCREIKVTGNLSSLAALSNLTFLHITGAAVSVTGSLSALSTLTKLQHLTLPLSSIGGDLSALSGLNALQLVELSGAAISGDLSSLYGCANLTILHLANAAVTGDLAALREHCPLLTHVDVSGTAVLESSGGT